MAVGTSKRTVARSAYAPAPAPSGIVSGCDVVTYLRIAPGGLDLYLKMLNTEGGNPRLKCFDGDLILVSKGVPHAEFVERIALVVKAMCIVLRIKCRSLGSTLYRKPGVNCGIEPDKTFYVQNFAAVRGRKDIDLSIHPPPDLVVEVVGSHSATTSLQVCRDLGVPEVWVYDVRARRFMCVVLKRPATRAANYSSAAASQAFSFLSPADVEPWLVDPVDDFRGALDRKVRSWVRVTLAPRYKAMKNRKRES